MWPLDFLPEQGEAVHFSEKYKRKQNSSFMKLPRSNLTINNNPLKPKYCSKIVGGVVSLPWIVSTDPLIYSIDII